MRGEELDREHTRMLTDKKLEEFKREQDEKKSGKTSRELCERHQEGGQPGQEPDGQGPRPGSRVRALESNARGPRRPIAR